MNSKITASVNSKLTGDSQVKNDAPEAYPEYDELSIFERERVANKLAFTLLCRTRIYDNAMNDRRLGHGHRHILSELIRTSNISEGGVSELRRDEICQDLGITRKTLRNKLHQLYQWGYISQKVTDRGYSTDAVVFGDAAVDRSTIQAEYVSAIGEFCRKMTPELQSQPSPHSGQASLSSGQASPISRMIYEKPSPNTGTLNQNTSPHSGTVGSSHDLQHEPPTLLEEESTTSSVDTRREGVTVAAATRQEGGKDSQEEISRAEALVADISKWANMPPENSRQWISTQRKYLNGNEHLIFEAARILGGRLACGDLISQPMAFLSKTINALAKQEKASPAKSGGAPSISNAEREAKLRMYRSL